MLNAFNLREEMLSRFVPIESKIKSLLLRVTLFVGFSLPISFEVVKHACCFRV